MNNQMYIYSIFMFDNVLIIFIHIDVLSMFIGILLIITLESDIGPTVFVFVKILSWSLTSTEMES